VLTASARYRDALPRPVRRETEIKIIHGDTVVDVINTEALISGGVSAQLSSRVTRSAEFTLPGSYFPQSPTDLLSPYRAKVLISTGIGYTDGSREIFPIFKGRVYQASMSASGLATFRGDDLAADVISYRFETPASSLSGPGTSTVSEIRRLVQEAVQTASFGTNDVDDGEVPVLAWDDDRGKALDDLANALHARWYTLGNGDFVIRKFPYTATAPLLSLTDGPLGTIVSAARTLSRDGVTAGVTVVAERLDGSEPLYATVHDNNQSSPTYFNGLFGKVTQVVRVQSPSNVALAYELARRQLVSSLALSEQWSADVVPDYTLEPGDTVSLTYRGATADQVLDEITYPLTASGTMSIQGRSSIPEPTLIDPVLDVGA
jgi:uncharacterized protein DUF5047